MVTQDRTALSDEEKAAAVEQFQALGICVQLAEAAAALGWKEPTTIQRQAVPPLIQGALLLVWAWTTCMHTADMHGPETLLQCIHSLTRVHGTLHALC